MSGDKPGFKIRTENSNKCFAFTLVLCYPINDPSSLFAVDPNSEHLFSPFSPTFTGKSEIRECFADSFSSLSSSISLLSVVSPPPPPPTLIFLVIIDLATTDFSNPAYNRLNA